MTAGTAEVRGDGDTDALALAVDDQLLGVRECYARALACTPGVRGELKMKFVVKGDGTVQAAEPIASNLGSPGLEECARRSVLRWQVPAPQTGLLVVHLPLSFEQVR